jgi:2-polyprenyl-3-methyl-5-hydroxy-6-metoxy-1,4-benzoquinol methylase
MSFKNVACNHCGREKTRLLFQKDGYNIVRCTGCGLVYVNPRKESVLEIYNEAYYKDGGYYQNYIQNGENYIWSFKKRMNVLSRFIKPESSILDIGCAYGFFLEVASDAGHQVEGIEANKYMVENVKNRLKVPCHLCVDLNEFKPVKKYDCISFFDSIEHMENPKSAIAKAGDMMNKGGHLVITTPNIGSITGRVMGKYWPHITPEEHIYYFTTKSLTDMLSGCGFKVVHMSSVAYKFKLSEFIPKLKNINKTLYKVLCRMETILPRIFQKSVVLYLGDIFVRAEKLD